MSEAAFDSYAATYDDHFTFSAIGKLQRAAVYRKLFPLLRDNHNVLEVNCGTGTDAVAIAPKVRSVLATDVSPGMISVCRSRQHNLSNLRFAQAEITALNAEFGGINFVFSDFGGLNCLSPQDLGSFANSCAEKLPPGSQLFFVIMGRKCAWERLYFGFKGDRIKRERRQQLHGAMASIGKTEIETWYYNPHEIENVFNGFEKVSHGPIGLFVPPSYLEEYFSRHRALLSVLGTIDRFTSMEFLSNRADHFYIHMVRS